MTDQELITAVAKNVMGWPVLDRPVENNDTGETVFFWDEDKPVVAKAYETSAQMRSHGACNYGYMWHKWNPLTDPAAMFDVIQKIHGDGLHVIVNFGIGVCTISNLAGNILGKYTSTDIGRALCMAAIQWAEANQIESSANTDMLGILQEFMATRWPDEARYAAIDYNGNVFCYMNKPTTHQTVWITADPGTVIQTGWLAIEDGADWKKLIVDRPAEEDKTFTAMSEVFAQMFALSDNLPAEYRWITCDAYGRVCAWIQEPTLGSGIDSDPLQWSAPGDYFGIFLGSPTIPDEINLDNLVGQLIIDRQPAPDSVSYAHQIKA